MKKENLPKKELQNIVASLIAHYIKYHLNKDKLRKSRKLKKIIRRLDKISKEN